MGRLTIRDIAQIANVSRSTVSLALNDSPRINPDTKKRVLEIVEKLDYHPNAMARALVGGRTKVLSLLVPKIDHVFSDTYFSETISGVTDAIQEVGYSVMLQVATEQFLENMVYDRLFKERRIDGMLIVGSLTTDEWIGHLAEKRRPICLVNSLWDGVSSVVADNIAGAERVVDHLVETGHREIGYLKGLDITTVGQQRDEGFRRALQRHGIALPDSRIAFGNFSEPSGREAMEELLSRSDSPSAVFTTNDMMAIGALHAARARGLRVPEDIAVVGGDDIRLARYISPCLTTIHQPMDVIGCKAVDVLMEMLEREEQGEDDAPADPIRRVIDTRLIVRDSAPSAG